LKSETILTPERRYYLDLKENARGRFLKIAMVLPPPAFERSEILIPAQGMVDLRDVLSDLFNEFGLLGRQPTKAGAGKSATNTSTKEDTTPVKEETGLSLKAQGKTFYFSVSNNKHGTHLRISEVYPHYRTAVNIPREVWGEFLTLLRKKASLEVAEPAGTDFTEDVECEFTDEEAKEEIFLSD
jgi:hypothetical protein